MKKLMLSLVIFTSFAVAMESTTVNYAIATAAMLKNHPFQNYIVGVGKDITAFANIPAREFYNKSDLLAEQTQPFFVAGYALENIEFKSNQTNLVHLHSHVRIKPTLIRMFLHNYLDEKEEGIQGNKLCFEFECKPNPFAK